MIKADKEIPFIITLWYLLALIGIRLSVTIAGSAHSEFAQAAKMGGVPGARFYIGRNIILFGYHIHHFYIGIFLIGLAAWFAIVGSNYLSKKHTAAMYGIGLGLFFDEIGLLLTWGNYFSSLTYTISIFVFAVFLNIVFFHSFWESVQKNLWSSRPHNTIEEFLVKNKGITHCIDFISRKTARTDRVSLLFSGILYLVMTFLILQYPKFLRFWVAGTFILHGLSFFPRAFYVKVKERIEA